MKKSVILISSLLIIGLSACSNNIAQTSDLKVESDINLPADFSAQEETVCVPEEPEPPRLVRQEATTHVEELEITERRALHEGGEELVFRFNTTQTTEGTLRHYDDGIERARTAGINRQNSVLTVESSSGDFIQKIERAPEWLSGGHRFGDGLPVNFVDFNFDGYLDIVFGVHVGGTGVFWRNYGYIWNPELGRFTETILYEIPNSEIDEENQVIRGWTRSIATGDTWEIWRYCNGDFVMTNELWLRTDIPPYEWDEEIGGFGAQRLNYFINTNRHGDRFRYVVVERELVSGEMVDVWPDIISNTHKGEDIIREHLFGEDSIWFPGQER